MIYRSRAPLRLGLGGGGTDIPSYALEYEGVVLNATIDMYVYCTLTLQDPEQNIVFHAQDREEYVSLPLSNNCESESLPLHAITYNYMINVYNKGIPIPLVVETRSEVAAGSGLGSSSALVVAMIQVFVEYLNLPLDRYDIAQVAIQIERVEATQEGGLQDQYAATFGGVNFMHFLKDEAVISPLVLDPDVLVELEYRTLLYYTGVSRDSTAIIKEQSSNVSSDHNQALDAMHRLKAIAYEMKEALLKGDIDKFAQILRESWLIKKQTADRITNASIESIIQAAFAHGAQAAKISGAGGGGFLMLIVQENKRDDLARILEGLGGELRRWHFTSKGAQSWSTK